VVVVDEEDFPQEEEVEEEVEDVDLLLAVDSDETFVEALIEEDHQEDTHDLAPHLQGHHGLLHLEEREA